MYVPRHFANDNPEDLHRMITENPLGALVTGIDASPEAAHVPCVLDPA